MRGVIPGLPTPHPILHLLPGVFQDDDFTGRFVAAFDDSLAPVFSVLDNLWAYIDPETAPADMLEFVGHWVGAGRDERTPLSVQRVAVREAVHAHRRRGTSTGVAELVRHLTGGDVEVIESGATAWSHIPGAELPGTFPAHIRVRIVVDDPDAHDVALVDSVVADAVPPHVARTIEVVAR